MPRPTIMWHLNDSYDTTAGRVAAGRAGDGPPLVLAHGWPWSSYAWHRVIPALARHYRVHWYDMPGFGRSELHGPRRNAIDTQGEVFAEMLDHWRIEAPRVIAHDFGGAVSLRAHLLHGRAFAGLALMNVVAVRPWGSAFFEHVKAHVAAFLGLPAHIHAAVVRAYIDSALARQIPAQDIEALVAPWLSEEGQAAFWAQFALADERYTEEIEPHFSSCRCPVRVLWGEDDPWIPIARGQALARAIGTDVERLAGLGHLPQLEDPHRVAEALLGALEVA